MIVEAVGFIRSVVVSSNKDIAISSVCRDDHEADPAGAIGFELEDDVSGAGKNCPREEKFTLCIQLDRRAKFGGLRRDQSKKRQ